MAESGGIEPPSLARAAVFKTVPGHPGALSVIWRVRQESNPRAFRSKRNALPAELRTHHFLAS
jgi:hypothetical protein